MKILNNTRPDETGRINCPECDSLLEYGETDLALRGPSLYIEGVDTRGKQGFNCPVCFAVIIAPNP